MRVFFLKLFFGLFFCLPLSLAYSQTAEVDSLKQVLDQQIDNDSIRINVLIQLCMAYSTLSPNVAEKYGKRALALAQKTESAEKEAFALQACGVAYSRAGNYEKALTCYIDALSLNEELGQEENFLDNLDNIAGVCFFQGDYTKALTYCKQALNLSIERDEPIRIANNYLNIGIIYQGKGEYDDALLHFQKALLKYRQFGESLSEGRALFNMGALMQEQGDYDGAFESYSQALVIHEQNEDHLGTAGIHSHMGNVAIYLKKYQLASSHLAKALALAQKGNFPQEKRDIHRYYSRLDSIRGRYGSSLRHHHAYIAIRDSLESEQTKQKIAQLTTQFELDQKEQEVDLLQKESALQEEALRAKEATIRNQYWLVMIVGLVALAMMAGILIYTNRRRAQSFFPFEQHLEQVEATYQNNMQRFSVLSHHVQQPMRFIQNTITLINKGNLDQQESQGLMKDVERQAKYTSTICENLSYWTQFELDQVIPHLEEVNLATSLQGIQMYYAAEIERKGLAVQMDIDHAAGVRIDPEMLHLALRNVIGNAIAFSPPEGTIGIRTMQRDDYVEISIEDEGASMPPEQIGLLFLSTAPEQVQHNRLANDRAIGLWLSRQFLEKNKAEFKMESLEGKGMMFSFHIPAS